MWIGDSFAIMVDLVLHLLRRHLLPSYIVVFDAALLALSLLLSKFFKRIVDIYAASFFFLLSLSSS